MKNHAVTCAYYPYDTSTIIIASPFIELIRETDG